MTYTDLTVVLDDTIEPTWGNTVRDRVVNPFATAAARTTAITSPVEGMLTYQADDDDLYKYNGSAWVPYGHKLVCTKFTEAGTLATSAAAETAMTTWDGSSDATAPFLDLYIYRLDLSIGAYDAGVAGTGGSVLVRVRRTVNSTAAAEIGQWQPATDGGGAVKSHHLVSWVKNASGGNINASLGLTVELLVGGAGSIYGNGAGLPCILTVTRLGLSADHPGLSAVAWSVT